MIENAHKHLERRARVAARRGTPRRTPNVLAAAKEVGPSLFFSLLIITVAFLPIFVLGGESGRLFKPLAWTKTFAIAAGAILGITVVPVLMVYFAPRPHPARGAEPAQPALERLYEPFFWLGACGIPAPRSDSRAAARRVDAVSAVTKLGSEFMPKLDEGDLLYMPTTDPSVSVGKAREILQQTDKLIAQVPEVRSVHGKIGRADTATDPAPLSMVETVVQLETDRSKWRTRKVARFFDDWPGWLRGRSRCVLARASGRSRPEELKFGWHGARRHDAPGHRTRSCACRGWPTRGRTRSRTASTCCPPASRRRSASSSSGPTSRCSTMLAERTAARCARAGTCQRLRREQPSAGSTSTSTSTVRRRRATADHVGDVQDVDPDRDRRHAGQHAVEGTRSAIRSTCATRASCATTCRRAARGVGRHPRARRCRSASWRR
jgi:hypothetical protein